MIETNYLVTIRALGRFPVLPIDQDEFRRLKQSKLALDNALAIEEKYEILLANYIGLERSLLDVAISESVGGACDYGGYFEYRVAINTRLVNLLTSARLFLDQLPSNLAKILGSKADATALVEKLCTHEFEENEHYRFMENLRNHVQHAGLAVHHMNLDSRWTTEGSEKTLVFRAQIGADKSRLAEDKDFKKKVLQEIPERIDLMLAARSYVGSLSSIHLEVRTLTGEPVKESRNAIQGVIQLYADLWDREIVGLVACAMEGAKELDFIQLLLDWDDVRLKLQAKNRNLANLRKRYVTSECRPIRQPSKTPLGSA